MPGTGSKTRSPSRTQEANGSAVPNGANPLSNSLVGVPSAGHSDDPDFAQALARVARSVPHVAGLSAGRYGVAVTYGPGQRIAGIVLRRPIPTEDDARLPSVVETHIVLAAAVVRAFPEQRLSSTQSQQAGSTMQRPVLLDIADEIRQTLERETRRLRPGESWVIDIVLDDLRNDLREGDQPTADRRVR